MQEQRVVDIEPDDSPEIEEGLQFMADWIFELAMEEVVKQRNEQEQPG